MERHLITGATGLIGGLLTLDLLEHHPEAELVCLVRPRGGRPAQERLDAALRDAARVYRRETVLKQAGRRCRAVAGDLTLPLCGTSGARIGPISQIWHSAASLAFEDEAKEAIMRSNVDGTRHLAALAQRLGADVFNHISTAYVVGDRAGRVPAAPVDLRVRPNNWYEHSKILGERIVSSSGFPTLRILRPSAVIGHGTTLGATTFSGLYGMVKTLLALRLRNRQDFTGPPLRIRADKDALLNLVPVDLVTHGAVALSSAGAPSGVYHLSNASQAGVADTLSVIAERVGIPEPALVAAADGFTPAERRLDQSFTFYRPYLSATRHFELTETLRHAAVSMDAPLPRERLVDFVDWYLGTLGRRPAAAVGTA
ncbi:SDR family oxidoreductase [Streptomyces sp. CNQ085]|uniref:SDR family oxidoreductase n=1 Tax=Streptomyces sp. CNQ085 TaxID=2886944 RepID=UPI001F50AC5D|nr:SDR family oxidoreductase [Streptomyces sp. CNQ085]MCI0386334.1 SDR family oxidoreductase [Streptomyces sp. CNQ085]